MQLRTVLIGEDFQDMAALEALAAEAFPPEEYVATKEQIRLTTKGKIEFCAVYDGDVFVGFVTVIRHAPIAYLYFLAIRKDLRGKGYGSAVLAFLRESVYRGLLPVVDLETQDENASNAAQRKTRLAFYLRNGYRRTDRFVSYLGMRFEVLSSTGELDTRVVCEALLSSGLTGRDPRCE